MFDDNQGVALISQAHQGSSQPIGIPCMESHAGLIQHVEHTGHVRAEGGGQTKALKLAAGEGVSRPVEGEIPEAQLHDGLQSTRRLLDDRLTHGPARLRKREILQEDERRAHWL